MVISDEREDILHNKWLNDFKNSWVFEKSISSKHCKMYKPLKKFLKTWPINGHVT